MKANRARPAQPKGHEGRAQSGIKPYVLKLYVAGGSPKSVNAIANIKRLCEETLQGCYVLDVIDRYQQPQPAQGEHIIALPNTIGKLRSPLRRIIGDTSHTERVLVGLEIRSEA